MEDMTKKKKATTAFAISFAVVLAAYIAELVFPYQPFFGQTLVEAIFLPGVITNLEASGSSNGYEGLYGWGGAAISIGVSLAFWFFLVFLISLLGGFVWRRLWEKKSE